ncbi:YraN family protein [Sulfurimonas sp.]|uniref:YraN family protein n=1 Tax=Sulfurimonas sp. TaxID=2022749 RepID=UPI0035671CE7
MSRAKGNVAEELAVKYLYDNGYEIIERNFYSRFGEIDIIAFKDETLHFVEVKSGEDYEKAIQNITPTKLLRLIKTGDVYMKKNGTNIDYEYDALVVVEDQVWFIENITL